MSLLYWSHPLRTVRPFGLSSRIRTRSFDRLPPSHYGRQLGMRSFSAVPAILAAVHSTTNTIISIHATAHIPWFLLIPCFSIGINAILRLPLSVHTRKLTQRRAKASLVMQGWGWRVPQAIHKDGIPKDQRMKEIKRRISRITSRIDRALGTQKWKMFSRVLTFPSWFIGIETIRQLCGSPRGILGTLLLGRVKSEDAVPSAQQSTGDAMSPTDISLADASQGPPVDPSTTSTITDNATNILDPSLAFEGCLWFPDLTVPDPYHILPLALSAMLVVNAVPKGGVSELFNLNSSDASTPGGQPDRLGRRIGRISTVFALLLGPLTMDMPVAFHLYWLVSTTTGYTIRKATDHLIPIEQRQVERCKGIESNILQPRRKAVSQKEKKTKQTNDKP